MSRRGAAENREPSLQHNTADAGSQLYAVQDGNQYIYNYASTAPYRVSAFGQATRPMPDAIVRKVPSRMLAARNHLVPFHPRPDSMAWLTSWRDAATPGLSVRLIYAPGGQGKTRLAQHFCAESEGAGWTVVLARHSSDPAAAGQAEVEIPVPGAGLLLLIDYADRWNTTDLLACLRQHAHAANTPIRALLLGRSAGGWSDTVTRHLAEDDNIEDIDQLGLPPLAATPGDRADIYRAARARFAAPDLLDIPDIHTQPMPDLTDPDYERVLDLHMRALADVHAAVIGSPAPTDQSLLTAYLLQREQDSWRTLAHDPADSGAISTETMGRAVYLATLLGPLTYPDASWLLGGGRLASSTEKVNDILAAHGRLYPPSDPATQLSPLYPDRVGEDFLALNTPGHGQNFFAPDPWAAGQVARLLQQLSDEDRPAAYTTNLLIVLIETARRWPHILHIVSELLTQQPALALAAGGTAVTRLVEISALNPAVLQAIDRQLPSGANIDWDIAAAAVTQRLVAHPDHQNAAPSEKARMLDQLGYRLANAGDRIGAYDATAEAVAVYWALAQASPAAYTPNLAASLNNLGIRLAELGRREEALAVATEATNTYRALAETNPAAYTPDLAMSLSNLGARLAALGRREEALTVATEATDTYRALAQHDAAAYTPDLAASLSNLSITLAELGRREEALTMASDATDTYRALAKANPAAYTPDLAKSLNNLGNRLAELGRREEALTVATEAVTLRRALAKANPAAYTPNLAASLNNLSITLAELGRCEDALSMATEATDTYRALAQDNPAAHTPNLAMSLSNLGIRLAELGRREEALTVTTEAREAWRIACQMAPGVFESQLAGSEAALARLASNS